MVIYIGIDNGLKGGISIINDKEEILDSIIMPITKDNKYAIKSISDFIFQALIDFSIDGEEVKIVLETAYPRPVSGKRACFMTGYGYGIIKGIIGALDEEALEVSPSKWMKDLGLSSKYKKGSVEFCSKKYPKYDFRASKKCRVAHDGKTDSCCIAIWGNRRKW